MRKIRIKTILFILLMNIVFFTVVIVCFEAVLRAGWGFPKGIFRGWVQGKSGLYPESSRIHMPGPIPYTVEINSHGFRGPEIVQPKPHQRIRIAAIGDSYTDGFFVENEATYPSLLQKALQEYGRDVEVINAAHGGGSINKELEILRNNVLPLSPDLVILAFATNDISDIRGISREDLINEKERRLHFYSRLFQYGITKTATGEWYYDFYIHFKSPAFKKMKKQSKNPLNRYQIEGGDDYPENVRLFMERFKTTDGLVLHEPFSQEVEKLCDNYLFALEEFNRVCREHGIVVIFVYFPAYSQVYDSTCSGKIQEILESHCTQLSIPLINLTRPFQEQGSTSILHLAPVDFHLNPEGNKVAAAVVARYLHDTILICLR